MRNKKMRRKIRFEDLLMPIFILVVIIMMIIASFGETSYSKSATNFEKIGITHLVKLNVETNSEYSQSIWGKNIKIDGKCIEGDFTTDFGSSNLEFNRICSYSRLMKWKKRN